MEYLWGQPTKVNPLDLCVKSSRIDWYPFYSLLSLCVVFKAENIFWL